MCGIPEVMGRILGIVKYSVKEHLLKYI